MNVEDLAEKYIKSNFEDNLDNDIELRNSIKFAYIDGYNYASYTYIPVHHKNNCIYIDNKDLNLLL